MDTPSLLDDCQSLIEKGHESWKSYFSKWEAFAKYEEDIPETELFNEPKAKRKLPEKKKVKHHKNRPKSKVLPSVKQKNGRLSRKRLTRKKRSTLEGKQIKMVEKYRDPSCENLIEDVDNMKLETILKTIFTDILRANKEEFPMFTILSQTVSGRMANCSQIFHQQQILQGNVSNTVQSVHEYSAMSVSPLRSSCVGNLNRNLFASYIKPKTGIKGQIGYSGSDGTLHKFQPNNFNQPRYLLPRNPTLRQTQINLGLYNNSSALSNRLTYGDAKLKSVELDLSLKPPNSVCRKINEGYFIKRSFLKMNITHDGKRFRNLCLRKRTNSVTLSMENSNFITPERKPPERKCFSENVLRRKRTCPSKLFFGSEGEDSESDDETKKQTPIIHCRNKKPKTISESDSDDCESIFDRVKMS